MQAPPPVTNLVTQLATMAVNVDNLKSTGGISWLWRPAEHEWSLTEVMCHLRDVEKEVHQPRFAALMVEDNAFISGVSADDWAAARSYRTQNGIAALDDFLTARGITLDLLTNLSSEMWERKGRHAFFGPTSMHELLFLVVRHDELHWDQIQRLLKGQLAAENSGGNQDSGI